jgi:hypothetical protein
MPTPSMESVAFVQLFAQQRLIVVEEPVDARPHQIGATSFVYLDEATFFSSIIGHIHHPLLENCP